MDAVGGLAAPCGRGVARITYTWVAGESLWSPPAQPVNATAAIHAVIKGAATHSTATRPAAARTIATSATVRRDRARSTPCRGFTSVSPFLPAAADTTTVTDSPSGWPTTPAAPAPPPGPPATISAAPAARPV